MVTKVTDINSEIEEMMVLSSAGIESKRDDVLAANLSAAVGFIRLVCIPLIITRIFRKSSSDDSPSSLTPISESILINLSVIVLFHPSSCS